MNPWKKILGWQVGDFVKVRDQQYKKGTAFLYGQIIEKVHQGFIVAFVKEDGFDIHPYLDIIYQDELEEWNPKDPKKIEKKIKEWLE